MNVETSLNKWQVERLKNVHKRMGTPYVAWIVREITGCTLTEGLRISRAIAARCE